MSLTPLRTTLCAIALALAASTVAQAAGSGPAAVRDANAIEAPLLAQVNAVRRDHALAPLRRSTALTRAAEAHARSMGRRGYFSHSSVDGTSPATRIRRYYRGLMVGETLLWRSPDATAEQALQLWLDSPDHKAILLKSGFREIGLAAVHVEQAGGSFGGRDVTIVVADFGAR
jgi:uncharacterized protein YkwD